MTAPDRHVACVLGFRVEAGTELALQIAPATSAGELTSEQLTVTVDGQAVRVDEVPGDHGGRTHLVRSAAGRLDIAYTATVQPSRSDPADTAKAEAVTYLRQSRYCPSDELAGYAANELRDLPPGPDLPQAIAAWVFERLIYDLNTSGPFTTAIDTLAANAGACRDFAHLTIALCRSRGIPARLVAVYAPGLTPMDFHAVVEVLMDGAWEVLDPTRLAPRSTLVRIATGRDAADTAFATTLRGDAELLAIQISAFTDGDLPLDDHVTVRTLS